MASFTTFLGILLRRSLANRALLATVVVGIVLSSALMASVILYSDAIRDLGLRHALEQQDPLELDLYAISSSHPLRPREYADLRDQTVALFQSHAGNVLDDTVRYVRTATFFLTPPGQPVPTADDRPRAQFQFMENLREHVTIEGRLPAQPAPVREAGVAPEIEVLLGKATADLLGVKIGDRFELHPYWRLEAPPVKVTVVGIAAPNDETERFWFGKSDRFSDTTTFYPNYRFFVSEEAIVNTLAAYLPDIDGTFETFGFVGIGRINARNAGGVEGRVRALGSTLPEAISRSSVRTSLPGILETYRTKLFFTRLPLFALMVQVVGIALYYLMMVATMLVERQSGEIALLKSRGASTRQVMALFGGEAFILCALGALAGPFVALAAIGALGYTPSFDDLSHGTRLEAPLSTAALGMSALGAGLAFAAMLVPAYRAARRSMVHHRHELSRPPVQPLFLRYYLDLALIGVAGFAFYQLRQRGSFVTERLFGDLSADPLLLISPTLFMLMVALVFLRLFPLALRLVSWAVRGVSGATVNLGLSRMVRAPLHYSRLILLLLLATAVGMFAAGFRATLDRSYDDRAAFEAGAAARLERIRKPASLPIDEFASKLQTATGASAVMPAARIDASYSLGQYKTTDLEVLAVMPGQFEDVGYWRGDFASRGAGDLMERLAGPTPTIVEGNEVPAGTRYLGVWARVPLPQQALQLGLRLQDPDGTFWDYRLLTSPGQPANEWQFFVANLAQPVRTRVEGGPPLSFSIPKRLDSIYLRHMVTPPAAPERMAVLFDDLQALSDPQLPADLLTKGFAGGTVVEDFENMERYEVVRGHSPQGDPGSISRAEGQGRDGGSAALVAFTRQRAMPGLIGLRLKMEGSALLPVLVSNSFLELSGLHTGDEATFYLNRQYVRSVIAGSFEMFPTHEPSSRTHLLVTSLPALEVLGGRVPFNADSVHATEAWLAGADPALLVKETLEPRGVAAEKTYDRAALRAEAAADPLVAASWEGILFLSFAAVLALTALGFGVYAAIAAESRSLEFAILRTMGFSGRQILSLVTFEQMFVIVGGVVAGTLLGFPLGRLMIGYLGVTETGADPVPPLLAQVSRGAVITVYALLALVFIGTIGSLATTYSRLAVHRALRMGEQ